MIVLLNGLPIFFCPPSRETQRNIKRFAFCLSFQINFVLFLNFLFLLNEKQAQIYTFWKQMWNFLFGHFLENGNKRTQKKLFCQFHRRFPSENITKMESRFNFVNFFFLLSQYLSKSCDNEV